MRVLITGLTGKTGRCLLDELKTRGTDGMTLAALLRDSSDAGAIEASGVPVEIRRGDLDSEEEIAAAMRGTDTVLHIAGIQKSLNVVRAAVRTGVRRLILVHTTGIYSKYKAAGEEYRQTEAEIEKILLGTGITLTILRPTMIFGGPDDKNICVFIRMVDRLRLFPVVSGGRFALQPVHRKDLGRAYYDVLTNPEKTDGKNYILSGEKPMDFIDLMRCISEALGKKTVFVSVPFAVAYGGAWTLYVMSLKRADFREKVQRLVEPRDYPHDAATADFGYAPAPLEEGIRQEVRDCLAMWNEKG